MKVVSSNCFSWQCHKNNARRKISLGYSTVSRIWHFAFAFALLKFLDPLPCNTHTPSPLRSTRVTNPKVVYPAYCALPFFPFLLHLPWLGPKGPHGNSVSFSVYASLSLSISLPLLFSLFSRSTALQLETEKRKKFFMRLRLFSNSMAFPPPGTAASPLHQQSLAFSMVL